MSRYAIKFPFRVRIHGGEFDESARAIHREDGLKTIQAESGIVLESTIERKQMSTKTTFKRIALVTVAALGFGVMSVAPSNAALTGAPLGVTQTLSASTTTVVAGTAAKVTLTTAGYFTTGDTVTSAVALTNFSSGVTAAGIVEGLSPVFSAIDTTTATTNGNGTVSAGGSNQVASLKTVEVSLDGNTAKLVSTKTQLAVTLNVPGTYTYTITNTNSHAAGSPAGAAASAALGTLTTLTWTVVVTAPALAATDVFITTASAAGTAATVDGTTLTGSGTASATPVARIDVSQYSDAAKTTALGSAFTKAVVVSVTGAGAIGATAGDAARGIAITQAAGSQTTAAASYSDYFLHADGRTGPAVVTVSVDGAVVATKTFTFVGSLASYSVVASKKNIGVGETGTLTVTGKDSNSNTATLGTVTAVSSDATIATVSVVGGVVTVTGVKVGTATITLSNAATAATITKTETVTVLPLTAPTIAWKLDKDSYDAGEKMTVTITATGIADGARAAFAAAPTTNFNLSLGSATVLASPVFAAGVAEYVLYAPATPGTFVLSSSIGQAIDTEVAAKKAVDAAGGTYSATKVALTATITNPALIAAQEATDAANEATDAGNNAKDAADQAIEAADAATIAAQDAAAAAEAAGEMAVEAAEAAGAIAQDALDAANAATDAALSAAEAADAATAAATEAKESADAATAAVAALSAEVAKLMAALTAKVTTLSTLVAKIAKKVKA